MKDIKNKIFFGSLISSEESQKEKCIGLLQKLIKKQYILFTDRGNTSIKLALELMKVLKKKKNLIQDQGGWLTYKDFSKELLRAAGLLSFMLLEVIWVMKYLPVGYLVLGAMVTWIWYILQLFFRLIFQRK